MTITSKDWQRSERRGDDFRKLPRAVPKATTQS